jgi:hypothetical protein
VAFIVTSDSFVPAKRGAKVDADQLTGCDVDALVAAGHLTAADRPPAKPEPTVPAAPPAVTKE